MNDDWKFGRARDFHLAKKDLLLYVTRRVIVVVVETNLTEPNYARIARKGFEFCVIALRRQLGFMRVNTDAGVDPIVLISDADSAIERARSGAAADSKNVYDASGPSALQHFVTISVEPGAFQMRVGIDQHLLEAGAYGDVFEEAR